MKLGFPHPTTANFFVFFPWPLSNQPSACSHCSGVLMVFLCIDPPSTPLYPLMNWKFFCLNPLNFKLRNQVWSKNNKASLISKQTLILSGELSPAKRRKNLEMSFVFWCELCFGDLWLLQHQNELLLAPLHECWKVWGLHSCVQWNKKNWGSYLDNSGLPKPLTCFTSQTLVS